MNLKVFRNIEDLPTKMGMMFTMNNRGEVRKDYWAYRDGGDIYKKVRAIVRGSAGKSVKVVHQKVKDVLPSDWPHTPQYMIEIYAEPCTVIDGQLYYVTSYGCPRILKHSQWDDYYILDNVIKFRKGKHRKTNTSHMTIKKHQENQDQIRAIRRERDKQEEEEKSFMLTLINDTDAVTFYRDLASRLDRAKSNVYKYKQKLLEAPSEWDQRQRKPFYPGYYHRELKKEELKVASLKEEMNRMKSGEWRTNKWWIPKEDGVQGRGQELSLVV